MKFLAHHEFGLLQKPFVFNEINSKKYLKIKMILIIGLSNGYMYMKIYLK